MNRSGANNLVLAEECGKLRGQRERMTAHLTHACPNSRTRLAWVDEEAALRKHISVEVVVGDFVQNSALGARAHVV